MAFKFITGVDRKIEEKWEEISCLLGDASKHKSIMRGAEAKIKKLLSELARLRAERVRLVGP